MVSTLKQVIAPFAGLVLVLVLSIQLYRAKVEVSTLRAEIARNVVPPVVFGSPLPELQLESGTDQLSLRDFCADGASVVLILSSRECPACQALEPAWAGLAEDRRDLRFVVVSPVDISEQAGDASRNIRYTRAAPADLLQAFGIREMPAVVVGDERCHIAAAAVGAAATRSLLDRLTPDPAN